MGKPKYVWCIAYINPDHIEKMASDLARFDEYSKIEHYIPTVRVLKKTFKNKQSFKEVPLLFNYGFLKISRKATKNPKFFTDLRRRVPAITGWVLDPAKVLGGKSTLGVEDKINPDTLALATDEEISNLIKYSNIQSIYSAEDLSNLCRGNIINLIGYPFEGMEAEVISIDHKKKQVRVRILMSEAVKETTVSFDNIFYTIYNSEGSYESNSMKEGYVEELSNKRRNNYYDIDHEF